MTASNLAAEVEPYARALEGAVAELRRLVDGLERADRRASRVHRAHLAARAVWPVLHIERRAVQR